jgi:hypothetical protein
MKWRGEERKGNSRFSDPGYIPRLTDETDEYRWLIPVSHALPILVGLALTNKYNLIFIDFKTNGNNLNIYISTDEYIIIDE